MRLEALPAGPERARLLEDAARLSLLAGQLLDAQRLERDSALLPLDLVELVRGVTAELAPLAVGAGYQIAFESGAGPVTVAGIGPRWSGPCRTWCRTPSSTAAVAASSPCAFMAFARSRSATRATACRQAGGKTSSNPSSRSRRTARVPAWA